MRVLLLVDSLPNGGAERQMALLATSLPAGWQGRVCALGGGPFEAHLRAKRIPVEVHRRRFRLDPLPAAGLWRSILAYRPDVVHSWSWISTLVAGPVCRVLRVPLIDASMQTGALVRPEHTWLKRIGMAGATTVVANTHAGLQALGVRPARGRVVYNGFDRSRFAADATAKNLQEAPTVDPEGVFTVVMVGRMVPARDFSLVITAARILRSEGHPYRFLLIGHGPERAQLMVEAADLVVDGVVAFPAVPFGMEVLDYVRQAQAGVLMANPEWAQEGLSNAIMEYMVCGLPVVCGEGGGNRELVEDGKTGFVIAPADPQALAQRIAYLREHEAERRAMGAAGHRRIVETFSLQRMVTDYIRIYEEALSA